MKDRIHAVITDHAPILHFHPEEGKFCCYPSDASLIFEQFSEDWTEFKADMTPNTLNPKAPCYYEYWNSEEFVQLRYWFWYNYNRFPRSLFGKGNHLGDWEHIEVRIYHDSSDDQLVTIWLLSNHLTARLISKPEQYTLGEFIPEEPVLTDKQVHAWVALGSHAHYSSLTSKPYCYARIWRDRVGDGKAWDTKNTLVPLREMKFYEYTGRWGDEKAPRSPSNEYNNRWRNASDLRPVIIGTNF